MIDNIVGGSSVKELMSEMPSCPLLAFACCTDGQICELSGWVDCSGAPGSLVIVVGTKYFRLFESLCHSWLVLL